MYELFGNNPRAVTSLLFLIVILSSSKFKHLSIDKQTYPFSGARTFLKCRGASLFKNKPVTTNQDVLTNQQNYQTIASKIAKIYIFKISREGKVKIKNLHIKTF